MSGERGGKAVAGLMSGDSEGFDAGDVDRHRNSLLQKLNLQHKLLASFVPHNAAAKSGQWATDNAGEAAGLQSFFARQRLSGLDQSLDIAQLTVELLLIGDGQ